MGKTSFVSNLVLNIGANTEKRLAAFLPKMSHMQFLKRIAKLNKLCTNGNGTIGYICETLVEIKKRLRCIR